MDAKTKKKTGRDFTENYAEALESLNFSPEFVDNETGMIILSSGDIIELSPKRKGGKISTGDDETSKRFDGVSGLIKILDPRIIHTTDGKTDEF